MFCAVRTQIVGKTKFFDSLYRNLPAPRAAARINAHKKEPAQPVHKKPGRVPDFLYSQREKVSARELSDVRVLRRSALSKYSLSAKLCFAAAKTETAPFRVRLGKEEREFFGFKVIFHREKVMNSNQE